MLCLGDIRAVVRRASYHVRIKVEGRNSEQFINVCLRRKLDLWGLKKYDSGITLCMSARSFRKNIRDIARKTGVKVCIIGKGGFFHKVRKYNKRIPLAVYGIIGVLTLMYCSSIIWHINVSGSDGAVREAALFYLEAEGIKTGASIRSIDTKALANDLIINCDGIKWATVSKKGTILNVELYDAESFGDGNEIITGPRHIIARKDALVKKIVATGGTAVAEENTVVLKGDMLISGFVYPIDEIYGTEPRAEVADGEVIGVVRYSAYMPVETEISIYNLSGNRVTSTTFKVFNKKISFDKGCDFENYDTVINEQRFALDYLHILPITMITTEYVETIETKKMLTESEAVEYAKINAVRLLDNKIPDDASIIKTGGELREYDGVTCYCVWAECEESIGEFVRLTT